MCATMHATRIIPASSYTCCMGRASSRKRQPLAGDAPSKAKGSIAEQIVATMHDVSGVEVAANVFLPVIGGGRRREIDVLITATVVGYQARYAIECKNERGAIGAPKIDAFIGKLKDVGIPPQYGIYVSVNGYTSGAVRRAKKEGSTDRCMKGLTSWPQCLNQTRMTWCCWRSRANGSRASVLASAIAPFPCAAPRASVGAE
jgi:Restriction endonuclease